MSLGFKLTIIFGVFLAMIAVMMTVAFRERKRNKEGIELSVEEARASDTRTILTIFGLIIGGMFTTLIVAWIVFF